MYLNLKIITFTNRDLGEGHGHDAKSVEKLISKEFFQKPLRHLEFARPKREEDVYLQNVTVVKVETSERPARREMTFLYQGRNIDFIPRDIKVHRFQTFVIFSSVRTLCFSFPK